MLTLIEYRGYTYYLNLPDELNHSELTEQLWWILKQSPQPPQTEMEFEQLYYKSKIWRGHKYQKMEYPAMVLASLVST